MSSAGVLILFAIVGAVICAKCRVSAGAVVFSLVALVLFIATPAGRGLPDAIASFLSTVDDSTKPALTHGAAAGAGADG